MATSEIPSSVTVCITSCGRLDLLEKTLASFTSFNTGGRFVLSEDSTDPKVIAEASQRYPTFRVLSGLERMGLMGSIDRIYSVVETPYIFHLEDDWTFEGPVDWAAAISLLESNDKVANVCVRRFDEIKPRYRKQSQAITSGGAEFRLMQANAHPEFFGWTSNPGLIRKSLYDRYKPFARLLHDQMSREIKANGQTVAYLLPGVAGHIGQGRNVTDPSMPARPKSRLKKWQRAIKKQLYYAGLRKEPF